MAVNISQYMVAINGVTLDPQPKAEDGLIWSLQDVHSGDSGRAEDGTMIMTVVAKKRKLQFKFPPMPLSKAQAILALIDSQYFSVSYFDPKAGARETRTFYKGDRSATWYAYAFKSQLSSLQFNVIEQ